MNLRVSLYSLIAIAITAVIAISVLFATVYERELYCHTDKESSEDVSLRIAGGELARPGQYRHVVSLQHKRIHFCGGALISSKHVLTAGQCQFSYGIEDLKFIEAVVGEIKLPGFNRYRVNKWTRHPDYNYEPPRADIGVFELETKIRLIHRRVQPIALPSASTHHLLDLNLHLAREVETSGFGSEESGGDPSPNLKRFSSYICACPYKVRNGQFFCSITTHGTGICGGDAGSAVTFTENKHIVIGIVITHYGAYCGDGKDVYLNVDYFVDWIRSVMKG